MSQTPKFAYYQVKGPALEVLRMYKEELEALQRGRIKLEEEFAARAKTQMEGHQGKLYKLWRQLAMSVGLDPDKTWGRPEYQIEVRYLKDGFGALLYSPRDANPINQLLGADSADLSDGDPALLVPSKDTTRH